MYVCMCVCMHVYTYIHTYTHAHAWRACSLVKIYIATRPFAIATAASAGVVAAAVGVFGCLGLRGQSICLDAWPVQQVPLELPHLPPAVASGSRPHREIRNPQHDVLALPPRVPPGNDLVAIGTRFPFSDSATAAAAKVAAAAF